MKHTLFVIVVAALCGAALVGCSRSGEKSERADVPAPEPVVDVTVARIRIGPIEQVLRVTGKTQVLHFEKINAPIAGKIIALPVLEGNAVKAGEIVAVIRTRESQAALEGARSAVTRAATPQQKSEADRDLQLAEKQANDVIVRAPFAGVIASRAVTMGEFVSDGADVVTLLDLASLYFMADVPAASLATIHIGDDAAIAFAAFPQRVFHARIDNINPQVDAASQMAKVRMHFSGPVDLLRGDMFGDARISIGMHARAVLVPRRAVIWNNETATTSIAVVENDRARLVPVTLGLADSAVVEIAAPMLDPETRVIVEGNHGLPDSTRVTVHE